MLDAINPNTIENLQKRIKRIVNVDLKYHAQKIDDLKINFDFAFDELEKREILTGLEYQRKELAKYINQVTVLQSRLASVYNPASGFDELESARKMLSYLNA